MVKQGAQYLEQMTIGDAKRLSVKLDIPIMVLLDASLSLSQNLLNVDTECCNDASQLSDRNVAVPA